MRQSKGSWGGNPSQIILFFMSGLSTESSRSCRGWGTHQALSQLFTALLCNLTGFFFLFQSPSGSYSWCITTGRSWWILVLLYSFLFSAWMERDEQHQGKSWGSLYPPKLENTRQHWKVTQPAFGDGLGLRPVLFSCPAQ